MPVPTEVRTDRLLLRPWQADDAPALLPVLQANHAYLSPWIPARVASPAPIPELEARLAGFAAAFAADREWRYALFANENGRVLGEVGLFPRAAAGRVPFLDADRVELGYWLRADATGQGLVTEAARAMLGIVAALPTLRHAEIRCDARNAPSAAVPRRLGFLLADTIESASVVADAPPVALQVWTSPLRTGEPHGAAT